MTLLSVIVALVLEQFRPLPVQSWVTTPLKGLAGILERRFNDGQELHGIAAWLIAVAIPVLSIGALHVVALGRQPVVALFMAIGCLYLTLGFRQFSHYFSDMHLALRMGELDRARGLLAEWRGQIAGNLSSGEVARLAIEEALVASHRHVFAPLFWFAVLGPAGALLYRLSLFFGTEWGARSDPEFGRFGEFSRRAFAVVDWLPVRISAVAFAVVGDFEDAVTCWRTQSARWNDAASGILLASGAGAMGVRLGMPLHDGLGMRDRPDLGLGEEADPDFMQSTIGLVWRTLVLGLLLLALLWVTSWVG